MNPFCLPSRLANAREALTGARLGDSRFYRETLTLAGTPGPHSAILTAERFDAWDTLRAIVSERAAKGGANEADDDDIVLPGEPPRKRKCPHGGRCAHCKRQHERRHGAGGPALPSDDDFVIVPSGAKPRGSHPGGVGDNSSGACAGDTRQDIAVASGMSALLAGTACSPDAATGALPSTPRMAAPVGLGSMLDDVAAPSPVPMPAPPAREPAGDVAAVWETAVAVPVTAADPEPSTPAPAPAAKLLPAAGPPASPPPVMAAAASSAASAVPSSLAMMMAPSYLRKAPIAR